MKVKYKKEKYNVNLKNAIDIWKRKILLILRRIKRFGLRVLYVFKKDLIILFIAIICYILVVVIIEYKLMNKNLIEAIWNTRSEVFTVFVVVAMNSIISFERNWRQSIRKWHEVYTDNLYYFEKDIRELNTAAGVNIKATYNMLYTRELYQKFESEIRQSVIKENDINKDVISKILTRMERETEELKENVDKNSFMQEKYGFIWNFRSLQDNIYDLKNKLDNIEEINIKEKLLLIYNDLYYMISYTRRIWRTEINLDREIIKILEIDNKKKIDEDYYLKAIIDK